MYHQTHVRFVYAHSEGVRSHHHPHLVVLPHLLSLVLDGGLQSCVVECRRDAVLVQNLGYLLRSCPTASIYYGASLVTAEQGYEFLLLVVGIVYPVGEVVSGEAHAEDVLLPEVQLLLYVVYHLGRGCGCEGEDGDRLCGRMVVEWRGVGEQLAYLGYLEVGWAEVVTPLADTVGFVYGDEAYVHLPHLVLENLRAESFGRDI